MVSLWVVPESREVSGEGEDPVSLFAAKLVVIFLSAPFEFFLCVLESTQLLVPLRFQDIGHQAVAGVDLHEPATRQIGVVAGALDLLLTQRVGFVDACVKLGPDLQGHLEAHRRDRLQQQLADGPINLCARDYLAPASRRLDTEVVPVLWTARGVG